MGILERFSLAGKKSLVTGGGTGIGRAIATGLAEAGADVALVGRRPGPLEETAALVRAKGSRTLVLPADVRCREEVDRFIDSIVTAWGRLDVAVNNAGIGAHMDTLDASEVAWDEMIDTNLKGPFLCMQAEARVMIAAGGGKIINNASMSGSIVNRPQWQAPYNTSKAGLVHLTRSVAAEWIPHGVYVNALSPGYIVTEMADNPHIRENLQPTWLRDTPIGRMGTVEDLQGAVIYLASDASNFTVGLDMIVDGGFTIF